MSIIVRNDEEMITGAEVEEVIGVGREAIKVYIKVAYDNCGREGRMKFLKICLEEGQMP